MRPNVLVTGASRGVGRGIALALLAEGASVHATARTRTEQDAAQHPQGAGSLNTLVSEAEGLPGRLSTYVCDHAEDDQTEAVIADILRREGRIDLLVNNAWPGYENMVEEGTFTWGRPFWEQPLWRWNGMVDVGLRTTFLASRAVAPAMVAQGRGLIVNVSFWAAEIYEGNAIYGAAKAATNKLAADFAHDLRPHGVAALSLYPGLVRTEAVMRAAAFMDLSNSESPVFIGRVINGLWHDPDLMAKSGAVHVAARLAEEYGIVDIDGRRPRPLTRADFEAG